MIRKTKKNIMIMMLALLAFSLSSCKELDEKQSTIPPGVDTTFATENQTNIISETEMKSDSDATTLASTEPISTGNSIEAVTFGSDTWEHAYLTIICNMHSYLGTPWDVTREPSATIEPAYLGIHDFNSDGTPELVVGDCWSLGVFTYNDGQIEKIADLYYPDTVWCVNGVYFKEHSINVQCNGAGGSHYVNFGFLDGEYKFGLYSSLIFPNEVMINSELSTLEEMNRIYTTHFDEIDPEKRREKLTLNYVSDHWQLKLASDETVSLDESFDFNIILWD